MEVFTKFLTALTYHFLEIVEALGVLAGELSAIHFPAI